MEDLPKWKFHGIDIILIEMLEQNYLMNQCVPSKEFAHIKTEINIDEAICSVCYSKVDHCTRAGAILEPLPLDCRINGRVHTTMHILRSSYDSSHETGQLTNSLFTSLQANINPANTSDDMSG